ncbi:AAA family ATPase [Streptomyces sp. INA 01156]
MLAAELLYVNMAPLRPEQIGVAKKREILAEVSSWASREVTIPANLEPALEGFINGGQGFLNYRWARFQILVLLAERLAALPSSQREALLRDPWAFRDECLAVQQSVGHKKGRAQIHVLQYLLFPETFLPIASAYHKQDILEAFAEDVAEPTGDVDRDLLTLRTVLEAQAGERINFYSEPWAGRWRRGRVEHAQRGWLVRGYNVDGRTSSPPGCGRATARCHGGRCQRFRRAGKPEIQSTVAAAMPDASVQLRGQAVYQLHAFLTLMQPGDLVVTVSPEEVHVGRVEGPAVFDASDGVDNARRRPVRWATADRPLRRAELPEAVQAQLTRPPTVYDISSVAAELAERAGLEDVVDEPLLEADVTKPLELPPVTEDLAQQLLMPAVWLRETAQQLQEQRQLIFYGPPGTGKTYLARALAKHLAGPDRVELVQFHPSYTYEDFFEGFRPVRADNGMVAFEVLPGPLKLLAERAGKTRQIRTS